ncbi:hypothetical protein F5Y12DRAFT_790582 [Xylaria sp. FL1777]|nr:hypothetical protein F5Y12DRAFT_790582 [Xylaria sp. FL1777]
MEPFTLSVPGYRLSTPSHKRRHHDTARRDAEARSPSLHIDSDTETQFSSSSSRLPSETINPLSHSPDTLHQLAVAGLSPEDELPSQVHRGFPHKPLPAENARRRRREQETPSHAPLYDSDVSGAGGTETDTTVASQRARKPGAGAGAGDADNGTRHSARIRHLNTMTAIMHRCLRDGDIVRAKRAFGLLVRTRDVDVRLGDLWAIGSEILMRDGEEDVATSSDLKKAHFSSSSSSSRKRARGGSYALSYYSDADSDSFACSDIADTEDGEEEGGGGEEQDKDKKRNPGPPQRWGTAANVAQVRAYLEALAQQHPHDAKRPHLTSAVDFWPALFGVELYNLDAEMRDALHGIYSEHGFPSSSSSSSSPSSSSPSSSRSSSPGDRMDVDDEYDMDSYSGDIIKRRRRGRRGGEGGDYKNDGGGGGGGGEEDEDEDEDEDEAAATARHAAVAALRASTQRGALELTARMDGILENAPYTTHAELLRLRAHAALFIGDLYLPSRLAERYARGRGGDGLAQGVGGGGGGRGRVSLREAEQRLRKCVKTPDEHVALARRGEEQERARVFFRRAVAAKGKLEEWVLRFLDEEEEEEEEEEE